MNYELTVLTGSKNILTEPVNQKYYDQVKGINKSQRSAKTFHTY
jgi:hypothetical protein